MATYILKTGNSNFSGGADFDKDLSTGTEAANTIGVTTAKAATEISYAYTVSGVPNNTDWETGTITVEVNVTSSNGDIHLDIDASRLNSSGAVQETTSAKAGEQNLSSVQIFNFTIPSFDWAAGATGDRLRINYHFRNSNTHAGKSVTIETGTVSC